MVLKHVNHACQSQYCRVVRTILFGIIIELLESKYLLKNSSSGGDLNIDYVKSQKPDCRQKSFEKVS